MLRPMVPPSSATALALVLNDAAAKASVKATA
jgi:hypothetical protein